MTEATRWAGRPAPEGDRNESEEGPDPEKVLRAGKRGMLRELSSFGREPARFLLRPHGESLPEPDPTGSRPQRQFFGGVLRRPAPMCCQNNAIYLAALWDSKKKDKEIARQDEEIETLKKNMICLSTLFSKDIETTNKELESLQEDLDITEGELTICQKSEKEWIGRALKLKFILDEIKRLRALPEDHAEWVDPMVDSIEFPEVSINVKDEFIPTAQTDNIDWVDDEEEEDEDGHDLLQCTNCGEISPWGQGCDCPLPQGTMSRMFQQDAAGGSEASAGGIAHYPHPRAILEKSAKTIQRYWRGYRTRVVLPRIAMQASEDMQNDEWQWEPAGAAASSLTIQRYWRGYSMRVLLKIRNLVVTQSLSRLHLLAIGEREQQRLRSRRSEREA